MKKLVSIVLTLLIVWGFTLGWTSQLLAADVGPLNVTTQLASGNLNAWPLYSNSPVMSFGAYGNCWYDGTTYNCYYEYNNTTDMGHATSPDGITWTEDTAHNPVMTIGPSGAWDDTTVDSFNVWQESGLWYALYRGNSDAIGLATSPDGVTWTKYSGNPVIKGIPYAQNPDGIMKVGTTYYLYASDSGGYANNRGIDILTSTDLHSWTLQTPSPTFSGDRTGPVPFKYNGIYYLLVSRYYNDGNGGLLELWQDDNPGFNDAGLAFDGVVAFNANNKVNSPSIITNTINRDSFPNNELYVYYSTSQGGNFQSLYLAIPSSISTAVQGSIGSTVTTDQSGNIWGALNGTLSNWDGFPTDTVRFQYGLTTNYGSLTSPQVAMSNGYFVAPIPTNLTPGETYHYQAVASNGTTTFYGSDQTFTVPFAASKLVFTGQPGNTVAGVNITPAVTVAVEDVGGNVVTTDNSTQVTLAITSGTGTTGAVLSGTKTVTVAAGVATFSNLNINLVGTGYTLTASSSPSYTAATSSGFNITAVNNGGGGGGGGGGGIPSPTTSGVTNVSNYVNAQGVFNQMISIWSDDLEGVVTVPSGTTGLTASGATLTQISFIHMTSPPAFQTGAGMIGLAYDITPNGITFNAAVSLEITYNPSSIPSGINPSSLQITYYDTTQNAWVTIPSTINTDHNYILAQISHFTSYAVTYGVKAITPTPTTTTTTITLPPVATTTPLTTTNTTTTTTVTTTTPIQTTTTTTPLVTTTTPITTSLTATFEASALSINPSTVKPNENVTINLKLTNTGNVSGTDTVILQINNSAVGSQIITLDRGASTVVIFTTNGIANGKYTVQVAGLNGNFSVSKNMSPTLFWVITIDAFLLVIILVIGLVLWRKRAS